jgi:hypothetical protein
MGKKWYQRSTIKMLRVMVAQELNLPVPEDVDNATEFWVGVERAGRLVEAIALYDEYAAEWQDIARETKPAFNERVEREGRQSEVQRVRAALLAAGASQREAQAELVNRFQPVNGKRTRAWETPDPWKNGRLFRKKEDQDEWLEAAGEDLEEDAEYRLECARWRQEERQALAAARRRAEALKQAAAQEEARRKAEAPQGEQQPPPRPRKPASPNSSANGQPQPAALAAVGPDDEDLL